MEFLNVNFERGSVSAARKGFLGAIAVVALGCFLGVAPTGPVAAQPSALPSTDFRLSFTELGELHPDSRAVLNAVVQEIPRVTDVFVFSHGWRNNPRTAEDLYQQFIEGMRRRAALHPLPGAFRPMLIGIYWPSAWFPVDNCSAFQFTSTELFQWARDAFPAAAGAAGPGFQEDLAKIVGALTREQAHSVTTDLYRELPQVVARWAGGFGFVASDQEVPDEPAIIHQAPSNVAAAFDQSVANNAAIARAGFLQSLSPCSLLNFMSFWAMKKRAGEVGARGVHTALRQIQAAAEASPVPARIHLIGHSFGSKVLSAAVSGPVGTAAAAQPRIQTLILIQGAFSHFAFASVAGLRPFNVGGNRPGRYWEVVDRRLVRGVTVAVYSDRDTANKVFYPIGAALAQDYLAKPVGAADSILRDCVVPAPVPGPRRDLRMEIPKYGAVGANGVQGVSDARCLSLARNATIPSLDTNLGRVVNVDATAVVLGHSQVAFPEVFDLVWTAVLAGRSRP